MIKLQYTPQADAFGDLPDLQEITMTLSDNASFENASREFCTFLMASGYKPPTGWDSTEDMTQDEYESDTEREWVGMTDDELEDLRRKAVFGRQTAMQMLLTLEAKLKEKNT